jgi:hypothetical protein
MTRRLLAVAALTAAFGPLAAAPAEASPYCNPVVTETLTGVPDVVMRAYWAVCGS